MLTVGSLFSGIGGIELGLRCTNGFQTVWQVEKDPYALRVLAKHWPNVARYRDVRYFLGGKRWRRCRSAWHVDVICGGFPCQDISNAGKRAVASPAQDQDYGRSLPASFAYFNRDSSSWKTCQQSLFADSEPSLVIWPRWGLMLNGAAYRQPQWVSPHSRWRFFLVAHRESRPLGIFGDVGNAPAVFGQAKQRSEPNGTDEDDDALGEGIRRGKGRTKPARQQGRSGVTGSGGKNAPDADSERCQEQHAPAQPGWAGFSGGADDGDVPHANGSRLEVPQQVCAGQRNAHIGNEATTSHAASGRQGQRWWQQFAAFCERQGRLFWPNSESGICGVVARVPNRVHRLRCLGNSVLPQLAEWIGWQILRSIHDQANKYERGDSYDEN